MVRTLTRVAALLLLAGLGSVTGATGASAHEAPARSVTPLDGGFVPITKIGTFTCLQPQSLNFGAPIIQVHCTGASDQNWFPARTGPRSNVYRFINQASTGLCMFVDDDPFDGVPVHLDECAIPGGGSVSNAEWLSSSDVPNRFPVILKTLANGRDRNLCLDAPSGENQPAFVFDCTVSTEQIWTVG